MVILLFISGPARCEAEHHGYGTSSVCLFYVIATVFQLYHDREMMYEMRRKSVPIPLPTQGTFNLLHHIGVALAFWWGRTAVAHSGTGRRTATLVVTLSH